MELSTPIICGDSLEVLSKDFDEDSVDLVVTSPPYFSQRTYTNEGLGNEDTIEEYLVNILETFAQIVRVVKPTGNIVYNMGDKVMNGGLQLIPYHFALKAIAQFDLRLVNNITWAKINPTPHQFPRRLTFSTEPFFHFALSKDYFYNRPAFLSSSPSKRPKPSDRLGSKYRELIETSKLSAEQKVSAHKALDEVIDDVHQGRIHSFRMKIQGIHAPAYGGQEGGRKIRLERDGFTIIRISGEKMKRDLIETTVETLPGNGHPAIFPVEVVRELIRLLCPPDGIVLDPYVGSGSTMVAAISENRHCIGIDISQYYCKQANRRITTIMKSK